MQKFVLKFSLGLALLLVSAQLAHAAENFGAQKLAIVNVSFVFENYKKVTDLQRKIEEENKNEENRLQVKFKELSQRNKELDPFIKEQNVSEEVFTRIQELRKDQYLFNRDRQRYDNQVQEAYSKGMKNILTDIRVAIRTVADTGRYDLVLRSPDTDDPEVTETDPAKPKNPADADKGTYLSGVEPRTVEELTERFNRNPVLYGAKPTDITNDVLTKLNEEYLKRSLSVSGAGTQK